MNTHSISKLENLTKLYSKSFNTIAIYSVVKENIKVMFGTPHYEVLGPLIVLMYYYTIFGKYST